MDKLSKFITEPKKPKAAAPTKQPVIRRARRGQIHYQLPRAQYAAVAAIKEINNVYKSI